VGVFIEQKHRPQENTTYSSAGVKSDIQSGKRSGYRDILLPQNACKHHFWYP